MQDLVQILAFFLPILAFLSVVLVLFVNLFLKLRRRFLAKVNCWFCNQWTKVPYDNKNCFECPTCLQYNGFGSDGGYNKPLPSQYDELLNYRMPIAKGRNVLSSYNGLCHLCNNNQQLKVYQLANFVPLNENNFDVEIEHFQKQLEKAYKLCPQCDIVVKNTINKQNTWFVGMKLNKFRNQGLELLDLNKSSNGFSKQQKRSFFVALIRFTIIIFAFLNLFSLFLSFNYSNKNLNKKLPKQLLPIVLHLKDVSLYCSNIVLDFYQQFYNYFTAFGVDVPYLDSLLIYTKFFIDLLPKLPTIAEYSNIFVMCSVGLILQLILFAYNGVLKIKLLQLLSWTFLMFVTWTESSGKTLNIYTNLMQIFATIFIIYSTHQPLKKVPKKFTKQKFKKCTKRSAMEDCGNADLSDDEYLFSKPDLHNSTIKSSLSNTSINSASLSPLKIFMEKPNFVNDSAHHTFGQGPVFENHLNNRSFQNHITNDILNQSVTTAKSFVSDQTSAAETATIFNNSFSKINSNIDMDLDEGLNNLHLGTKKHNMLIQSNPCKPFKINPDVTRPKPVLSPSRLTNITQNSWVAGGFWRNSDGFVMPSNLSISRSSSQSSGFASQTTGGDNFFEPEYHSSLPPTRNNSICGDFERSSLLSEPAYHINNDNGSPRNNLMHSKIFHPNLNQDRPIFIPPRQPELRASPFYDDSSMLKNDLKCNLKNINLRNDTSYKRGMISNCWTDKAQSLQLSQNYSLEDRNSSF